MKMNIAVAGASALAVTGFAVAGSVTIDLTGTQSHGGYGDASNTITTVTIGVGSELTEISWDGVTGDGLGGPSWGNEMNVFAEHSDTSSPGSGGANIQFFPDDSSGSAGQVWGPSSGSVAITGTLATATASGDITLHFYESYNDHGDHDAEYTAGTMTLTFTEIPAPGALALLGLAGIAGTRRRRG